MIYSQITRGIKVTVFPAYMEDSSSPGEKHYLWSYTIYIENKGDKTVQLLSRYWRIVDESGHVQQVRGEGVVGKQPNLTPTEIFEYSSQVLLSCPSGVMMGSYQMVICETGERFDITVPAFSLDMPNIKVILN